MKIAKGWFTTSNRDGDRTLEQQMVGLDRLVAEVPGKTVLDVGAAEGLIAFELARAGAASVHGVEIVKGHVLLARHMAGDLPCTFEVADANHWAPSGTYDVVILLALLHKLWNPSEGCRVLARAAKDLVVVRFPPARGAVIVDARSKMVPHDIGAVMAELGFHLEYETTGTFDEHIAYYRRTPIAPVEPVEAVSIIEVVVEPVPAPAAEAGAEEVVQTVVVEAAPEVATKAPAEAPAEAAEGDAKPASRRRRRSNRESEGG